MSTPLELVKTNQGIMGDSDIRSALGMAASHVRGGQVMFAAEGVRGFDKRDNLARELIASIQNLAHDKARSLLQTARTFLDAPHKQRGEDWRKQRAERGPLGVQGLKKHKEDKEKKK